jgi:hypothetical protein
MTDIFQRDPIIGPVWRDEYKTETANNQPIGPDPPWIASIIKIDWLMTAANISSVTFYTLCEIWMDTG